MNLQEIKSAVNSGRKVHWSNAGYTVVPSRDRKTGEIMEYLIGWDIGGRSENYIGLTWRDGITMNGKESEFFIGDQP